MVKNFRQTPCGSTILEYAILLMVIAVIAIATISKIGNQIENTFSNTTSNLQTDLDDETDPTPGDTNTSDPWVVVPSTTIPDDETPYVETLNVYPSCNDAYKDGNTRTGYYRLNVHSNEFTIYCYMVQRKDYMEG